MGRFLAALVGSGAEGFGVTLGPGVVFVRDEESSSILRCSASKLCSIPSSFVRGFEELGWSVLILVDCEFEYRLSTVLVKYVRAAWIWLKELFCDGELIGFKFVKMESTLWLMCVSHSSVFWCSACSCP